jgi:hypothetical protein
MLKQKRTSSAFSLHESFLSTATPWHCISKILRNQADGENEYRNVFFGPELACRENLEMVCYMDRKRRRRRRRRRRQEEEASTHHCFLSSTHEREREREREREGERERALDCWDSES